MDPQREHKLGREREKKERKKKPQQQHTAFLQIQSVNLQKKRNIVYGTFKTKASQSIQGPAGHDGQTDGPNRCARRFPADTHRKPPNLGWTPQAAWLPRNPVDRRRRRTTRVPFTHTRQPGVMVWGLLRCCLWQ